MANTDPWKDRGGTDPRWWLCGDRPSAAQLQPTTSPLAVSTTLPADGEADARLPYVLRITNTSDRTIHGSARGMTWILQDGIVVGGGKDARLFLRILTLPAHESRDDEYFVGLWHCRHPDDNRPDVAPLEPGTYDVYVGYYIGDSYGMAGPWSMRVDASAHA